MGKLIILSGPSCVGKSPLDKALGRFYPKIRNELKHLVLYNSRAPRPGELDGRDYHFRSREEIKKLGEKDHIVSMEVRGDLQALDIKELKQQLNEGDLFFEGNPFVGRTLQTHPALEDIVKISVFMSPLSKEEMAFLTSDESNADPEKIVTDIMRRKLLRRTRKQKGEMSLKDLENIERRASSAYTELKDAHYFDFVIPNHDGEDSENWDAFYYPVGDARKSLLSFVNIMEGLPCDFCEHWDESLIS